MLLQLSVLQLNVRTVDVIAPPTTKVCSFKFEVNASHVASYVGMFPFEVEMVLII